LPSWSAASKRTSPGCGPLLEDIWHVVTHVGAIGQAALVKLALNLSVAV
jgi:3-hydroxyisobutyrate dehydrogenase-like beta-hydroxyacid dehydrogenase